MMAAVIILGYIYYPVALVYLFPQPIKIPANDTFAIFIPKIHAASPIIPNVDPDNETEYLQKLKQGVAEAKGFALPGQKGITYLFAHSSDYPWNITRYNTAFFKLNELKIGDQVYILYKGKKYIYDVKEIRTVWPTQVEAITKTKHNLVLQTCTPIGTSLQRLLVYGDLKN